MTWKSMYGAVMRKLFFALLLSALVACGGQVTSEEYLARARNYIAESDYASASIELQNALKQDSNLAEARWLLGGLYFDIGNIAAAEHEFERARELGWSADDVLPALARTSLAQGKFDDVLAMEAEGLSARGAAELLSQQAVAALADGQEEKARELLASAESEDPESVEVGLARAIIRLREEDYTGALEEVDFVLQAEPEMARAWRLRAQALMRQERLEEARDALDKSIEFSRFAFADRVARALINIKFEEFEAAQQDANVLLEISPGDPSTNYVRGLLHFQNKNYLPAIQSLNDAEAIVQQYPLIYYYLAVAYQFEQDVELSAKYARQFMALSPSSLQGRKLQAVTLIQTGEYEDVPAVLRPLLESTPNDVEALNILANALLLHDQAYRGLVIYRQIRQLVPKWEIIPLRREARLVTGGSGEIEDLVPDLPGRDTNYPQTEILEILGFIEKEDYPAAIEAAKAYQAGDIESRSPYHVLGSVYMAAGQRENAREAFKKVLKRTPGDPLANMNLAQIAMEGGNTGAARKYYETILANDLSNLGAMTQLAALEAKENNQKGVLRRLEQARQAHPEALAPRLNLASYYMSTGEPEKVAPLFESLGELQRNSPRVLETTAMAQMMQKKHDEATATLEQLVATQPRSPRSRYLLAVAVSGAGDAERSKTELRKVLELDENYVPALLSLAKIANNEGDLEGLRQYMAQVVELAPDSLDVVRLQAVAALANGDQAGAIEHAQRAFTLAPSSRTTLELASYQWGAGEDGAARKHLEAWIDQNPNDVGVRMALADRLQMGADIPAAMEQYRRILDVQPGNVIALNNLAWHLKESDLKKALEYIDRAANVAPDNPSVLDTRALIQYENGDYRGANSSIQGALARAPDEPSIRYHAAMIHAALGEKVEAVAILEAITAEDAAEFPERAEAVELLASLGG
jgi:putative PEP-CTERM system TPR-repeat lipoprotein